MASLGLGGTIHRQSDRGVDADGTTDNHVPTGLQDLQILHRQCRALRDGRELEVVGLQTLDEVEHGGGRELEDDLLAQ